MALPDEMQIGFLEQDKDFPFLSRLVSSTPCSSCALVAKPKGKNTNASSEPDEKLINFLNNMSSKYGNPELISYDSCLKKLNMIGWDKNDPLYFSAFSLIIG
ncbi:hypothetical protein OSB04_030978 [Centaurea solstitialis]|uniref:Uncharacterized protein n=1 Tax=Centaurea solstitialis TaxID=347529 RepID=A0AA38S8N0_9ASTR|nr:hypothetical protein OSB04_030978 [Centaurea solstitialis]